MIAIKTYLHIWFASFSSSPLLEFPRFRFVCFPTSCILFLNVVHSLLRSGVYLLFACLMLFCLCQLLSPRLISFRYLSFLSSDSACSGGSFENGSRNSTSHKEELKAKRTGYHKFKSDKVSPRDGPSIISEKEEQRITSRTSEGRKHTTPVRSRLRIRHF